MKLLLGDCLDKLKELDNNSVDSIVTDPPYGLSFMGKKWDYDVPSQEIWEECMRVLKPGGHILSFAGSRTYHRMAVRIEDAGFEIRDQIMWVYGSGFPKSMNIGIQVDKKLGNEREVVGEKVRGDVEKAKENGAGYLADPANRNNTKQFGYGTQTITKGNSEWEGWGTALKPAHEPIVMARKPLSEKTVVDNVLEWGTGGINIDESRIETDEELGRFQADGNGPLSPKHGFNNNSMSNGDKFIPGNPNGRFPANIIFDEEAGKLLDVQFEGGASRFFYCPKTSKKDRNEGLELIGAKNGVSQFTAKGGLKCKKCNKWKNSGNPCQCDEPDFEQQQWNGTLDKNSHPTVKPTDLMLYLIRLVTPKGGTTLDPFMGSGSTGKAAVRGGFDFVGIEREEEYFEIAEVRINSEINKPASKPSKTKKVVQNNTISQKFW